ncbi:MAG TPA: twin-arginine translocase subunit TatC [Terracidiphilus sp.]
MSFFEHLVELRKRLINALIGVGIGMMIGLAFSKPGLGYVVKPMTDALNASHLDPNLYFTHPAGYVMLYINFGLYLGIALAMPWVLYQVWLFIAPGLYPKERRYVIPFVLFTSALFITGGLFAYKYAFPIALEFLISYAHRFSPQITINEYFDLFSTVVLGLGLIFELPTLIFFLSLLGLVTARFLIRNFRYAVLIIFVVAAVITPTADITTMLVFAAPMLGLYVLSIGIAWIFGKDRRRKKKEA